MGADWYARLEKEVQQFGGALPLDVFLPDLDPTARPEASRPAEPAAAPVAASAAPEEAAPATAGWRPGVPISEQEESAAPDPIPEPPSPKPAPPAGEPDLEAEIREWMNRDRRGASDLDEDDLSDFLGSALDPNLD